VNAIELERELREFFESEADDLPTCSCGDPDIEGACVTCGELRCGRCSVIAGDGIQCEDCRWGRA
jgi:hypothetical protein